MEIRLAKKEEIIQVESMIFKAAKLLQSRGIAQWERFLNIYNISICEEDFKRKKLYVLLDDFDNIVGSMSFGNEEDIDYKLWTSCSGAYFIHRLVISDNNWGKGYGELLVNYAKEISKAHNKILRLNAVENNNYLFRYYERQGLKYVNRSLGYNLFEW